MSDSGRYVGFERHHQPELHRILHQLWWRDRETSCIREIWTVSERFESSSSVALGVSDISEDGSLVLFYSNSSRIVAGDTNRRLDAFIRNVETGKVTRVSVSSAGEQANRGASPIAITPDGRYVLLQSDATNLVPRDTNGKDDLFVRDLQTGTTTRVSVGSGGKQAKEGSEYGGAISADGRYVAFTSEDSDLVPGDTNEVDDVFVHDRSTGKTSRISVSSSEDEADNWSRIDSISGDGRFIAFSSYASNLVDQELPRCREYTEPDAEDPCGNLYLRDRLRGTTALVSVTGEGVVPVGPSGFGEITRDGRYVFFENIPDGDDTYCDWWACAHAYVWERETGEISPLFDGARNTLQVGPVSRSGRYVMLFRYQESTVVLDRVTGRESSFNKIPRS